MAGIVAYVYQVLVLSESQTKDSGQDGSTSKATKPADLSWILSN